MTVTSALSARAARTRRGEAVRAEVARRTRTFTELAQSVRAAGLNRRTRWFYLAVFGGLVAALAGAFTGLVLLQDSWFALLIAAALGIIFTQFAFLGHEASHRQVVTSGPANDRIGLVLANLFVGISYSWWMTKHTRHHANPNRVGKDPDIQLGTLSFRPEDAATTSGAHAWLTRRQGWLFFPLLLLAGLDLHQASFRGLFGRERVKGRALELSLLAVRFGAYLGVVFWLLPLGLAFAFLGVQMAVFGVYMGASFAPNHIGMPIVAADARLDFLDKQVLTSRNVAGGWWMTILMGGLNYQIEHHLFPSLPRPHLSAARRMVRQHCRDQDVKYTETGLTEALAIVVRHLNEVGLAAPRTFNCPTAAGMGRG
ncbi:MAG: acyl-CoA desaturase [Propionibacteriaceae bacterium]|nr:acyl-CoA desaturase [Propionibacteriaceae bacterium]